jgi:penicillin amidase/acyl-homoserine-lactone acylase
LLAQDARGDADVVAAQNLFRSWDRRTHRDSRAAPLAVLTVMRLQQSQGKPPLEVLKTVAGELRQNFGRIDPTWGEVNRIRRGKVDLPIDGGPDIFRAVYGRPDPDGRLRAMVGDTLVMFVEWDKAGRLSSRSIHQFGSATLDETSPHYADQTPLFAEMKTKPVLFTEAQLKGHIKRDYRPGE